MPAADQATGPTKASLAGKHHAALPGRAIARAEACCNAWPALMARASRGHRPARVRRGRLPAPACARLSPHCVAPRARSFLRLWSIGGCVNAMRWFEVLAAALFTLDVTGSGLDVAVVSAARTMPMLFLGAFAGVMSEAVDRKRVLVIGQLVTAAASATVAILAVLGRARPWHVALAALVAGTVWSTEMSTRRRMVGESVPPALVPRALALDTMTNSVTRMVGPIIAGMLYQFVGLAGAFAVSAAMYLLAAMLAAGLPHQQEIRRLVISARAARPGRGHVLRARPRHHRRRAGWSPSR